MILNHLATACVVYLALLLQTSIAFDLTLFADYRPWFPGIALVVCVLIHDGPASLIWSAVLGLATDGLSSDRPGFHTMIVTVVAMVLLSAKHDIRSFGSILIALFVFAGTFLWQSLSVIAISLSTGQLQNLPRALRCELGNAVYTLLLIWFLLTFVGLIRLRKRESSSIPVLNNRWSMLTR